MFTDKTKRNHSVRILSEVVHINEPFNHNYVTCSCMHMDNLTSLVNPDEVRIFIYNYYELGEMIISVLVIKGNTIRKEGLANLTLTGHSKSKDRWDSNLYKWMTEHRLGGVLKGKKNIG